MKIAGKAIEQKAIVEVFIPRPTEPLLFRFKPINEKDFDKIMLIPSPPKKRVKGGAIEFDINNPVYDAGVKDYVNKKTAWMFLESISATEGLEWDTVDLKNAGTYLNWEKELEDDGFNERERMLLWNGFSEANMLDEKKIEEARARFLASRLPEPEISSSPPDGQSTT